MARDTVLLIDPNEDSREIYSLLFAHHGYRVCAVGDPDDGLAVAALDHPSVVVTELFTRTESGWRILDALRANPATADIPVIVLTAYALPDDRARASSADVFLPKPCAVQRVVGEADRLCHRDRGGGCTA